MFCALKGATLRPRRVSSLHNAVAIQLLPTFEAVPPTKIARAMLFYCRRRARRMAISRSGRARST